MKLNLKKLTLASLIISAGLLTACGGGSNDGPAQTAKTNTVATFSASNPTAAKATVAAVSDKTFTFNGPVPALGTASATTVTLKSAASPTSTSTFNIGSSAGTASGELTFGSCIFKVTASTFPVGHALALGQTITVNPCAMNVNTAGGLADGSNGNRDASLTFGTTTSTTITVQVSISPAGEVVINGNTVGSVTLQPATGAGS